jgi:PAS domain S-box-containing protein
MSLISSILYFFFGLWLLAVILLAAHRSSPRLGLTPLLIILGGLAAGLQFPSLGFVKVQIGELALTVHPGSYLFTPVLLCGLLIVYIVEGSTRARSALLGVITINLLAAVIQLIPVPGLDLKWFRVDPVAPIGGAGLRILLASSLALAVDLFVLVVSYQAISNLFVRYPSRLATVAALMVALWSDALVFALFAYVGRSSFWYELLVNLTGKSLAALILAPLLVLYVRYYSRAFPGTSAATPRPLLDIFTTSVQLEARARYHYSLLHTLLKINHLIVRAENLQTFLDQVCQLLTSSRDYRSVSIILTGSQQISTYANQASEAVKSSICTPDGSIPDNSPFSAALSKRQSIIIQDLTRQSEDTLWYKNAVKNGISSLAIFPLIHPEHILGILVVCGSRSNIFDHEEVELLEELADDLANAITNFMLRQEQLTLYSATETMLDGLLITDLNGKILHANPAAHRMLEFDEGELLNRNLRTFFTPDTADQVIDTYLRALFESGLLMTEFDLHTKDGHPVVFSVRASLVYGEEQQPSHIVIGVRDITRRRRYEHQILTLNRLVTDLVQIHDKNDLLRSILLAAEELLQAWASAIYLVSPTGTITDYASHNLSDEYAQRIAKSYQGLPGETAHRTLKPVCVEDVLCDPVYQERVLFMAEYDVRSLLVLPVLYQDAPLGALVVYYNQPHAYHEDEVQLGLTLAHTLAIAIQNLRLFQGEQNQRQLAEALAQAAASLNRFLNLDEVLDQILEQTLKVAACQSANILLVDGERARLVRRKGYGGVPGPLKVGADYFFPLTFPALHYMYTTGQPILMLDTAQDERWSPIDSTEWIRSYAGVPLKVGSQIVGFLNVDSDQPKFFDEETTRRLQALADYAATAIHNAQLYADSRRQAAELSTLIEAAATVTTSLDFIQVLSSLTEQMAHMVDVEGCAMSGYDPVNQTVTLLAYYRRENIRFDPEWNKPFDLQNYPVTRRVLEHGETVQFHIGDPDIDPAEAELMRRAHVNTLLMLPLVVRDQTIGLLELEAVEPEKVFTKREIALLETLGANAANAIQNARLYSQLQRYATELEDRVLSRTAELQSAKQRIESILASVPDAVFVLDELNQPIDANQAGEQLLMHALAEELDLFSPEFMTSLKAGRLPAEKAVLEAQGRAYQALISPLLLDQERTGSVVVFRDVTRFHELDQMKSRFVSDVSHELRTPLTNIMLYLDLLAAQDDPRKGIGYVATLQRETKRLGFLIEDLLTISRLEAGRVDISIKPTNVTPLLRDLVVDRERMASGHSLKLDFVPDEQLPPALVDASLFNQAVSNLLTNAINYTPPGGRVILSTHLRQEAGMNWVTVEVTDTGVGISAEELPLVFDRFYRGSASRQTSAPGTGLGLAIAREIANRVGGNLTVQSELGNGSTFTIWLKAVL